MVSAALYHWKNFSRPPSPPLGRKPLKEKTRCPPLERYIKKRYIIKSSKLSNEELFTFNNVLDVLLYIQLTISFLIGRKRTVNFQNQRLGRHPAADYTILMSRTLKFTGNHVMHDRGA